MKATIVCKDGAILPAEFITAFQCEAAYRRRVAYERSSRWHREHPEQRRKTNTAAVRKYRARKRGEV